MTLSTYGFCQGERGAVMTYMMPMASARLLNAAPYEASRSRSRKRGAVSHGNASVNWRDRLAAALGDAAGEFGGPLVLAQPLLASMTP